MNFFAVINQNADMCSPLGCSLFQVQHTHEKRGAS